MRKCKKCGEQLHYDNPSGEWIPAYLPGKGHCCRTGPGYHCEYEVTEEDKEALRRFHSFQVAIEDVYKNPLEYFSRGDK